MLPGLSSIGLDSSPLRIFLAQIRSCSLDTERRIFHSTINPYFSGGKMISRRSTLAWVLVLCLGLALNPVSLSAKDNDANKASTEKINLNTATEEQLQSLPGIGPSSAKNILEYRNKAGKFNRIEEIINVKGIGEKKFQKIKDRLTV
jgi:comEA protein